METRLSHHHAELLGALASPAAILDGEGRIVRASLSFSRIIGYASAEEAAGQQLRKWVDPAGHRALSSSMARGEVQVFTDVLLTSEHSSARPRLVLMPLAGNFGGESGFFLAQLSVPWTPGLRVHAEFPQFVAGVAHEVNNPLAFSLPVVHDLITRLQREHVPTQQLLADLDQVRVGLERIGGVIADLRTFSVTDVSHGAVDVNATVVDTVRLISTEAAPIGVSWDLGLVPLAAGEEGRLGQVLLNLLSNATKVLSQHEYGSRGQVVVRTWSDTEFVHIQVRDNGPGIPPDIVDRVFDPFVSRRAGGTGLGLTVCANLVHAMGGSIDVHSEVGRGSTFHIRLRRDGAARSRGRSPVPAPRQQEAQTQRQSRGFRALQGEEDLTQVELGVVLLVDDEPLVRRSVRRCLHADQVVEFGGGNQAIEWLAGGHAVDVVICDRVMPDGDGVEVLRWIRSRRPELVERMLFISGASRAGVVDADPVPELQKPFSRAQLDAAIRTLNIADLARTRQAGAQTSTPEPQEPARRRPHDE